MRRRRREHVGDILRRVTPELTIESEARATAHAADGRNIGRDAEGVRVERHDRRTKEHREEPCCNGRPALRRCDADADVVAAVAQLFVADGKADKARAWFNRATAIAPQVGDHWARFAAFEAQQGGGGGLEAVVRRAAAAAPRYGEYWTRVAKRPENAHRPFEETLKKVVASLEDDPPP